MAVELHSLVASQQHELQEQRQRGVADGHVGAGGGGGWSSASAPCQGQGHGQGGAAAAAMAQAQAAAEASLLPAVAAHAAALTASMMQGEPGWRGVCVWGDAPPRFRSLARPCGRALAIGARNLQKRCTRSAQTPNPQNPETLNPYTLNPPLQAGPRPERAPGRTTPTTSLRRCRRGRAAPQPRRQPTPRPGTARSRGGWPPRLASA